MSALACLSKGTPSSPLASYYDQRKTGAQVTKCQVLYKAESCRQFLVFEMIILKVNLEAHFCN